MKNINIFISSAIEELEYEREIAQEALKKLNINPLLFETFPALNQSPYEICIEEVRNCDIFILILGKTFRPAVEEEYKEALKSNKPVLIFIKSLVENEKREERLEKFINSLKEIGSSQIPRNTVFKNYRRILELKEIIRESVIGEIAKFYREPTHTLSREEMYGLGTSIIRYSQKRLYLFEKTPSLYLGARDYLATENSKFAYEKDFVDLLQSWIEQNYQIADKEFLYLFSLEKTKRELADNNLFTSQDYIQGLKRKLKYYEDVESKSSHRFRFRTVEIPFSGPLIIGDDWYAMWILGGDDAISISQINNRICDLLARILKIHSQKRLSSSEIISDLGI